MFPHLTSTACMIAQEPKFQDRILSFRSLLSQIHVMALMATATISKFKHEKYTYPQKTKKGSSGRKAVCRTYVI